MAYQITTEYQNENRHLTVGGDFLCPKGGALHLEVKINKEIRNYTESMFFGLSRRQFVFSVLACGVAVGLYFLLRPHFGTETLSWMCILGAAPFALIGFVKYNGMTAEQFLWAWIKLVIV